MSRPLGHAQARHLAGRGIAPWRRKPLITGQAAREQVHRPSARARRGAGGGQRHPRRTGADGRCPVRGAAAAARVVLDTTSGAADSAGAEARSAPCSVHARPPSRRDRRGGREGSQAGARRNGLDIGVFDPRAGGRQRLFVEGGGRWRPASSGPGCVDRVEWFRAPMIPGRARARPAIGDLRSRASPRPSAAPQRAETVGDDSGTLRGPL
jgi:diaminohydroxyphosphoribosylaminopyrimidine deaminase/5-amino-6-(5-phosphoribosylamino)uracil reductase